MVAESGALVEQGKKNRYLGVSDNWTKESKLVEQLDLTSSAGPARNHRVPVPT